MGKLLCILAFILVCLSLNAQQRYDWKRAIPPIVTCAASGASWGIHQKTTHHWAAFKSTFPGADPYFWNPAISWQRPQYLGYKFDAKHLLVSYNQVTSFGAGVTICIGEKRPWWHYAIDAGLSFGGYWAGNYVAFDLLYSKNGK